MRINVFNYLEYKTFISDFVKKQKESHFVKSQIVSYASLAKDLGVKKSFMSQVISGELHLSSDQAYLLTGPLELKGKQSEYFLLMVEFARTKLENRKRHLKIELENLRKKFGKSRAQIDSEFLDSESSDRLMTTYLSDPFHSIVHVFLTVEKYRKSVVEITSTLKISSQRLANILNTLSKLKLIKIEGSPSAVSIKKNMVRITDVKSRIHTPDMTDLNSAHQMLMRSVSLERLQSLEPDEKEGFHVVFSCDPQSFEKIKSLWQAYTKSVSDIVKDAGSERIYQLNFDLFSWTQDSP